ncbi:MAG: hypothetical protein GY710_14395 [Desulfobacteraceae bacterium]|nr:hypothetical protein [Desulfobacteraceae bacterium]
MKIPLKTAVKTIEAQFSDFARNHIFPLPGLGNRSVFPEDLWKKMGEKNLLNPALFNGRDLEAGSCLAITRAGRALVYKGGNLGISLSWMIHHLVARYLFLFGDIKGKQSQFIGGAMTTGEATISFAVSEPKGGAHPKYMAATAKPDKAGYILNGEKTYLTNGPIATAFVVIAVTGYDKGKKQFSAFFVPRDTRGLTVLPPMEISFFNPSPHNSICLKDCWVPDNALLGRRDHAHGDMVLAFKKVEDAAMTGPVTGAMAFLLDATVREMTIRKNTDGEKKGDGDVKELGGLSVMLETAQFLSWNAALAVDDLVSYSGRSSILLYFKDLVSHYVAALEVLVERSCLILPDPCGILIHDLKSSARIGKNISRIQQAKLGRSLMQKNLEI